MQEVSLCHALGGDPFIRFWNKKGMILDELTVSRYDKEELNKILIGFGLKYVPDLTWDERNKAGEFFSSTGLKPSDEDIVKEDL